MAQSRLFAAIAIVGVVSANATSVGAEERQQHNPSIRSAQVAPLLIAAGRGAPDQVAEQLAAQASANTVDADGNTALMLAAMRGHVSIARQLIEAGTEVDRVNERGESALMLAAANGSTAIVRSLLSKGASVHLQAPDGTTAIESALLNCHDGAAKELATASQARLMDAALLLAASRCSDSMFEALAKTAQDREPLLRARDGAGRNAVWHAANKANAQGLKYLIAIGVPVDAPDEALETPLHRAAGDLNTAELLLVAGANPNAASRDGMTPLMRAAFLGSAAVKPLLAKGAAPNARNRYGQTALMLAAASGHSEVVAWLLAAGADRAVRNTRRETARDLATLNGHTAIAAALR